MCRLSAGVVRGAHEAFGREIEDPGQSQRDGEPEGQQDDQETLRSVGQTERIESSSQGFDDPGSTSLRRRTMDALALTPGSLATIGATDLRALRRVGRCSRRWCMNSRATQAAATQLLFQGKRSFFFLSTPVPDTGGCGAGRPRARISSDPSAAQTRVQGRDPAEGASSATRWPIATDLRATFRIISAEALDSIGAKFPEPGHSLRN